MFVVITSMVLHAAEKMTDFSEFVPLIIESKALFDFKEFTKRHQNGSPATNASLYVIKKNPNPLVTKFIVEEICLERRTRSVRKKISSKKSDQDFRCIKPSETDPVTPLLIQYYCSFIPARDQLSIFYAEKDQQRSSWISSAQTTQPQHFLINVLKKLLPATPEFNIGTKTTGTNSFEYTNIFIDSKVSLGELQHNLNKNIVHRDKTYYLQDTKNLTQCTKAFS